MVQTYQAPTKVYHYPFDIVMEAYEKRFPSCELIPIFVDSEILEESHDKNDDIKIVKRRCKLKVEAPYLLKKIIGMDHANFIQINTLDLKAQVLKIEAFNENYTSRVEMNEICYYKAHPENASWTTFDQEATLNIKSFFNFEAALEKIIIKHYINNIGKGKEVLLHFIKEMEKDGGLLDKYHVAFDDIEEEIDDKILPPESQFSIRKQSNCNSQGFIYMTPLQENKLVDLKKIIREKYSSKIPNETHLLRFLKAREFNVEKASEMLIQSLIWRKHHQIDKIILSYQVPDVIQKYFPGGWMPPNQYGPPMYCLKLGETDIKGLYSSLGMDGIIKHVLYVCEQGLELCQKCQMADVPNPSTIGGFKFNSSQKSESDDHIKSTNDCTVRRKSSLSNESISRGSLASLNSPERHNNNNNNNINNNNNNNTSTVKPSRCYAWNLLLDLRGLGVRHLWTPGIKAVLKIVEMVEANYPETLNAVWVVGAPWIFPVIWTLVSPFIDETTRRKFVFFDNPVLTPEDPKLPSCLATPPAAAILSRDPERRPGSWGQLAGDEARKDAVDGDPVSSANGRSVPIPRERPEGQPFVPDIGFLEAILNCQNNQMSSGGTVPKSYYLSEAALNDQNNSFKDNIYHTIHLPKGQLYEVIIEAKEHGTVLTWDFDVKRFECAYQVLYSPLPLASFKIITTTLGPSPSKMHEKDVAPTPTTHHRSTFRVATHSGHNSSIPVHGEDRGLHCIVLNNPITCHEGESVQGSHFVKAPGCYILQWHLDEAYCSPKPTTTSFDFSLTLPKCKLMYFYEIIHPEAYEGSMSSLHSVTSGFSSLNTADCSFTQTTS